MVGTDPPGRDQDLGVVRRSRVDNLSSREAGSLVTVAGGVVVTVEPEVVVCSGWDILVAA